MEKRSVGRPKKEPSKRKWPLPLSQSQKAIDIVDSFGRMRLNKIVSKHFSSKASAERFYKLLENHFTSKADFERFFEEMEK